MALWFSETFLYQKEFLHFWYIFYVFALTIAPRFIRVII